MTFLDRTFLGSSLSTWLVALAVSAGVLALLWFGRRMMVWRLRRLAERTVTQIDDLIVELLADMKWFFLAGVALYAGASLMTMAPATHQLLGRLLILLLLIQGGVWGNRVISFWIGRTMKRRMEEDAASATTLAGLRFISKLLLYTVILLLALDNFGVNITTLVTGLGIGGIAVALAIQSVLGDLFASLSIVLDKPFVIGDFINVDEYMGTVEHIGLKTTRVRSLSGEQLVFSNSDLLKSRIRNYKHMQERRVAFTIGVTYQTPLDRVAAIPSIIRKIIEAQGGVRFDRSHFKTYGDSALVFETVYYVLSSDYNAYMDIQQAINLGVYEEFAAEGIEFAYPTRTLYMKQEKE